MRNDLEEFTPLSVTAALASSYGRDVRGFLPLLAIVLQGALPDETTVERRGGVFVREKPVRKVSVALGDLTYTLEDTGRGPLAAHRVKVVRGITLKTEPLPVDLWLADLGAAIAERAGQSERAFFALQALIQ